MGYPDWCFPIIFVLQEGELWPIEQWVAHQGQHKVWENYATMAGYADDTLALYTVPHGSALYVTSFIVGWQGMGRALLLYSPPPTYFGGGFVPTHGTVPEHIAPPMVIHEDKIVYLYLKNDDANAAYYFYTMRGFELTL